MLHTPIMSWSAIVWNLRRRRLRQVLAIRSKVRVADIDEVPVRRRWCVGFDKDPGCNAWLPECWSCALALQAKTLPTISSQVAQDGNERECVARVNYFKCVLEHLRPTIKSQKHPGTHTKRTKLKVTVDFGMLQKQENCCVWRSSERECVARVNYFNCVLEHLRPTTKSPKHPGTHTKKNETESHSRFWDAPKTRKLLCMEII